VLYVHGRRGQRGSVVSFGEDFYLTTANPWRRFKRNVRLLVYLLSLTWTWLVVGDRVRRACRTARRTGRPFYLDELAGGEMLGKHAD
ncbi:MAG: hypothetical protein ACREB3_04935, partial [Burkholderiales bacterium]